MPARSSEGDRSGSNAGPVSTLPTAAPSPDPAHDPGGPVLATRSTSTSGPLAGEEFDQLSRMAATGDLGVRLRTNRPLLSWTSDICDAWATGLLTGPDAAQLEQLLGGDLLTELGWDSQYRELARYLQEQFDADQDVDLRCDLTMQRTELWWARHQQLTRESLTADRRRLLARLPGWEWRTYCDQLLDDDLPGLRFLAHSGDETSRQLARLVYMLPVEAAVRMALVEDAAGRRVLDVLRAAAEPAVRDKGLHLLHLVQLLPEPVRQKEGNLSFLASHLDHTGDPHVAATLLGFMVRHDTALPDVRVGGPSETSGSDPAAEVAAGRRWSMVTTHVHSARHIASLGLAARTHNALVRAEITRIGEILAIEDPHVLLDLRGFGASCLDDLRARLLENDIEPPFGVI